MDVRELHAPFPRSAIHWRAQSMTHDKKKAMALAYIDARDVMDRLDEVCGPDRWQSEFAETAKGRVICRIGILTENGWVWKSDGAGNTDVEAEKGGISDALKRAAVGWGIGRYLYRLPAPWVPCEVNSKGQWRRWTADPWDFVRDAGRGPLALAGTTGEPSALDKAIIAASEAETEEQLRSVWNAHPDQQQEQDFIRAVNARKKGIAA